MYNLLHLFHFFFSFFDDFHVHISPRESNDTSIYLSEDLLSRDATFRHFRIEQIPNLSQIAFTFSRDKRETHFSFYES